MTIYAISGRPHSGRSTLAKRLVGENVWDLGSTRVKHPIRYLSILETVIKETFLGPIHQRIAIDGLLDPLEVAFIRAQFPSHEVTHYHVSTGDYTTEPNGALCELAATADYCLTWRRISHG